MHEWLSGGVSPCQGEGRGFESRLVLFSYLKIRCGIQLNDELIEVRFSKVLYNNVGQQLYEKGTIAEDEISCPRNDSGPLQNM